MTQKLDPSELQNALALSQAACYASMSAKDHREGSDQALAMLDLTQKLSSMATAALDAAILPEIVAAPGEQTLADFVEQAKAADAAGTPAPEIVLTAPIDVAPAPDPTLAATDYTPLPVPATPTPVTLPTEQVAAPEILAVPADPVPVADTAPLP